MAFFGKKRYLLLLLLLLVTGGIVFFYKTSTSDAKKKEEKKYIVKRQSLKEILSLSGKIEAEEKVVLRFQTSGKLIWVGVKEGNYVKKYQAIASVDQREVKKNLEKSLRDYSKERWDLDEDKEVTYKNKAITDTMKRILEKNQFDLDKAVLDVEIKQLAIEFSTLITPIEGIVTRVGSPFAGVNMTPSQAEFEIVNPQTVYFASTADQTDIVKLKEGLKGEIILDAFSEQKIKGEIYSISFTPKEGETGTVYEVKISLDRDNANYRYRLGMTGDVEFILKEKKNVLVIPTSYIRTEKGKKYLWKKIGEQTIKTFIRTGKEMEDEIEIIDGIYEQDVIVNQR